MVDFNPMELLGLFESLKENEDDVLELKERIKVINKETSEKIKEFSSTNELNPADVKDAYKYYKKVVASGETGDEYFTLCNAVDTALAHENEGEE